MGVKFGLHKKCDRNHEHGKCEGRETRVTQTYTNQIVDIILKSVRRHMSIRFKELWSKEDDTCSSCKHDRRSAKKTAVSITHDTEEIATDLMWLMMRYHMRGCPFSASTVNSGYQLNPIDGGSIVYDFFDFLLVVHRRTGDRKTAYISTAVST